MARRRVQPSNTARYNESSGRIATHGGSGAAIPMSKTILVVDDKANVRTLVRDYLTEQGLRVVVADNGQNALYAARHEKPDLILLDIMMPEMDGFEFIRAYRKESDTPIILLTARLEETDKVAGLELGADDYITKPFGMRELLARIRTVLRRTSMAPESAEVLRAADILLNRETHSVTVGGRTGTPHALRVRPAGRPHGRPGPRLSRGSDLLRELEGTTFEGVARTIDQHVRNLRAKIEPDPAHPRYVETVFGVGYRFAAG